MPEIPVIGQGGTNNPLLILAESLSTTNAILSRLEVNTRRESVLAHNYGVQIFSSDKFGKVWGSFCLACSDEANDFVYPCKEHPDEPLKPPAFFTVDKVFMLDHRGSLRQTNAAQPPPTGEAFTRPS